MKTLENLKKHQEYDTLYGMPGIDPAGIILEGDYQNRHFAICRNALGTPVAYIEVKSEDLINKIPEEVIGKYESRYDYYIGRVHGGMTYYGNAWWNKSDKRTYLGWDYGHCSDYQPSIRMQEPLPDEHKWDILEIMMDIACAELGLLEMNFNNDRWWEEELPKG